MSCATFCTYLKSFIFIVLSLFAATALAGETTRVSVSSNGKQGNGYSSGSSISANGRYVAFSSSASNLVAGDTNNVSDVFVHDRQTKQTTRTSVASNGMQGNFASGSPIISADGRFVAFQSSASNLVLGDTNNQGDIFVYDRQTKQTTRVSVASNGTQSNSGFFTGLFNGNPFYSVNSNPTISADGRFVAFESLATNLVAGDTNGTYDVFVHDRLTKQTSRISTASNGEQGNSDSASPSISADGRFVAYISFARNLVAGDTNGADDVFVHDRLTIQTSRISIAKNGNQVKSSPIISADGRFVAFQSVAKNNIGAGGSDILNSLFVHDRQTKQTSLINNNPSIEKTSISADGRFVVFYSFADSLVVGNTNSSHGVFVYDHQTKQTLRISTASHGVLGNFGRYSSSISADGRFVTFESGADNLVAGDTNDISDVFVRDRWLDQSHQADLKVAVVQKPAFLKANSTGAYQFIVTNLGSDVVNDARLTHVLSNGSQLIGFTPTQGSCNRYTTISLCRLGRLLPGKSVNLYVVAKATRDPLTQNLSVSGAPKDAVPQNNNLTISTKVTP